MARSHGRTGVQGPNSALTEFLRSRGISASDIRNFGRARGGNQTNQDQAPPPAPVAHPLPQIPEADDDVVVVAESSATVTVEVTTPPRRGRQRASKKKRKVSDDEYSDEDEEIDTSKYGRASFSHKKRAAAIQPGKIDFCYVCSQRFTISPYTKQSPDGEGLLCHKCGAVEQSAPKKEAPKRKRMKVGKGTAKMILEGKEDRIGKLQDSCIKVIAKHIHDVEALGDIGSVNMDKICQIISRNRSLDNETLPLFLQPELSELRLYDCSRVHAEKLEQIAYITPNLSTLQLSFCGRLVDSVLAAIVSRLHQLEHLILTGPFLITKSAWKSALQTIGRKLRTFEISDTARWDEECSKTLVTCCPNLETVAFKRINGLSNESIKYLSTLKHLKSLDLTEPVGVVTDEEVVPIIQSAGKNLEKLVLDGCVELSDKTLQAIVRNCAHLHTLSLVLLDRITDECVVESFGSWKKNPGLVNLNLTRCVGIKDPGVQAILAHSGTTLETLNLNSLDELTQETFKLITEGEDDIGCDLVELDVGFVRCINDDLVYALSNACKELRILKVFGDNYVTPCAEVRSRVRLIGKEDFL